MRRERLTLQELQRQLDVISDRVYELERSPYVVKFAIRLARLPIDIVRGAGKAFLADFRLICGGNVR